MYDCVSLDLVPVRIGKERPPHHHVRQVNRRHVVVGRQAGTGSAGVPVNVLPLVVRDFTRSVLEPCQAVSFLSAQRREWRARALRLRTFELPCLVLAHRVRPDVAQRSFTSGHHSGWVRDVEEVELLAQERIIRLRPAPALEVVQVFGGRVEHHRAARVVVDDAVDQHWRDPADRDEQHAEPDAKAATALHAAEARAFGTLRVVLQLLHPKPKPAFQTQADRRLGASRP